jgi:transcriptional regulator with XRE-family HTH domain
VPKDWVAVGEAIDKRLKELGWRQRQLAERSNVSQAIVRELQHHTLERRRSSRTLEALSIALGWHPQHLEALSNGQRPPELDEPVSHTGDTVWSRLDEIEEHFDERLDEIASRIDELKAELATVLKHVQANR